MNKTQEQLCIMRKKGHRVDATLLLEVRKYLWVIKFCWAIFSIFLCIQLQRSENSTNIPILMCVCGMGWAVWLDANCMSLFYIYKDK